MKNIKFNFNRIAVIRLSSLGDILLTFPTLKLLRNMLPAATIDIIVKKQFAELFNECSFVDNIFFLEKVSGENTKPLRSLLREMRKIKYDVIFDWHANLRSYILTVLLKKDRVIRYNKGSLQRRILVNSGIHTGIFLHTALRYSNTLKKIGITGKLEPPNLEFNVNELNYAQNYISNDLNLKGNLLIGFAPGARHFTKRWLKERFKSLALKLIELNPKNRILLFGDKSERKLADEIQEAAPVKIVNLSGKLSLRQTAAFIQKTEFMVTNDSGLMHLSTAVNTPVFAIFGPTSEELGFFPMGAKSVVIQAEKQLSCRPCSLHGSDKCPNGTYDCMKQITVEQVLKQIINQGYKIF